MECAIDSVRRFLVCAVVCIAGFRFVCVAFAAVICVGSALLCVESAVAIVDRCNNRRMDAV